MMDVGVWRTSYFFWVLLLEKFQVRSLCHLMTTTGFSQQTQIWFQNGWLCQVFLFHWWELLCVLILSGNGVEIVRGGDAWLLGSVRILEHRGGHWSSSMKSFSAKSSRTLNPLSCDCGRHIDCGWPFFLECSGFILSLDVRLWCCMLIYILHNIIYIL